MWLYKAEDSLKAADGLLQPRDQRPIGTEHTENQFGRNEAEKILKFQPPLGSVTAPPVKY